VALKRGSQHRGACLLCNSFVARVDATTAITWNSSIAGVARYVCVVAPCIASHRAADGRRQKEERLAETGTVAEDEGFERVPQWRVLRLTYCSLRTVCRHALAASFAYFRLEQQNCANLAPLRSTFKEFLLHSPRVRAALAPRPPA